MHTVIYVIPFIASMEAVINDIDLKKMYIVTPTKKLAVAGQDRVPLPASSLKMSTEKKHTAAHLGSSPPPPKKEGKANKWRLIPSSPEGHSVTDGIPKELASLSCVSGRGIVDQLVRLGPRTH